MCRWGGGPDVVLVGEHDDGPGVGRLQQASDNLVELSGSRLPGDLQGLGDAHAPCKTDRRRLSALCLDKSFLFFGKFPPLAGNGSGSRIHTGLTAEAEQVESAPLVKGCGLGGVWLEPSRREGWRG